MNRSTSNSASRRGATMLTALWVSATVATAAWAESASLSPATYQARDTLARIDEPAEDARRCLEGLVWPASRFEVQCRPTEGPRGDALVRFPSPIDTGDKFNDVVAMEWYVARDPQQQPLTAPAVIVVHESGRGMTVGRMIARGLRPTGVHTFLIHLPNYGERGGRRPADAAELITRMRQAVADVRRARDAVAAIPLVDQQNISLQGTSLGGFVAATTAGLDDGYDRVFVMLAGGNLHDLIEHGQKDAAKLRAELKAAGLTGEKLRTLLDTVEPIRLAHRIEASRTWLYSGSFDDVVPMKNALALAAAVGLDDQHHCRLAADHYSGMLFMPFILTHMRRQISQPLPASSP